MTEQSDTDAGGASEQAPKTDPAHTYPHSWVVDVLASDGGAVALRPIVPEDADKLVEFHGKLSERTRYLRYFGPYPRCRRATSRTSRRSTTTTASRS